MATAGSRSAVAQLVKEHGQANGLVIVISNDYSHTEGLSTLNGTIKDNRNMRNTFQKLNFAVISEHNVTYSRMLALITSVVSFESYPPSYRRIVFVFSGHGTDNFLLYTSDSKRTTISTEYILEQFSEAPRLARIPKLFFIDACRGDEVNPGRLVAKGGKNMSEIIPAGGSWLLAYSTLPKQKSYEETGKGGVWMSRLAERIRTDDSSINDILTTVNEEMMAFYRDNISYPLQQPEFRSRLNQCIFFLKEASRKSSSEEKMIF